MKEFAAATAFLILAMIFFDWAHAQHAREVIAPELKLIEPIRCWDGHCDVPVGSIINNRPILMDCIPLNRPQVDSVGNPITFTADNRRCWIY